MESRQTSTRSGGTSHGLIRVIPQDEEMRLLEERVYADLTDQSAVRARDFADSELYGQPFGALFIQLEVLLIGVERQLPILAQGFSMAPQDVCDCVDMADDLGGVFADDVAWPVKQGTFDIVWATVDNNQDDVQWLLTEYLPWGFLYE